MFQIWTLIAISYIDVLAARNSSRIDELYWQLQVKVGNGQLYSARKRWKAGVMPIIFLNTSAIYLYQWLPRFISFQQNRDYSFGACC